jgi:hypothetical protein
MPNTAHCISPLIIPNIRNLLGSPTIIAHASQGFRLVALRPCFSAGLPFSSARLGILEQLNK